LNNLGFINERRFEMKFTLVLLGAVCHISFVVGWWNHRPVAKPSRLQCQDESLFWKSVVGRRSVLSGIFLGTILAIDNPPLPSHAANPTDAGEAIRRAAAAIPGFGPTDMFFPPAMNGSWKMTREVELKGREAPLTLTYTYRFIQSIDDDAVVADRGLNQAALEEALVRAVLGPTEAPSVRSYEWTVSNPNDLRLVLADGSKKEIKVTKRATDRTGDTVSCSEFQRVTQENASNGIPQISARRVVTKWKLMDESNRVEGIEIVYNMGGGDPLSGSSLTADPIVLSKSCLTLVR
jgi:hypothetical protein